MTLSPVTYDPERSKGNPVKLVPNATTAASWLCLVSMGPNKAQSTALICIDVAGGRLLILSLPSQDLKELPLIDLKGMARGSHNLLKITFKQETILVLAEDEQQLGEIARFAALSPACQMPMSFIPLAFTCIRSFRDIKISSRGTKGAASDPSTILAFDTRRVSLTLLQWSLKFAFADTGDESTAQEWNLDEICGLQLNEDTRDSSDRDVLRLDFEKDQCVVVSCARTQAHRCFVTLLMARVLLLRMGLWPEMRIGMYAKKYENTIDLKFSCLILNDPAALPGCSFFIPIQRSPKKMGTGLQIPWTKRTRRATTGAMTRASSERYAPRTPHTAATFMCSAHRSMKRAIPNGKRSSL